MTRLLYLDCFSGISGDMMLGALVDIGVDVEPIRAALGTLALPPWTLTVGRTQRQGLAAAEVRVHVGDREEGPATDGSGPEPAFTVTGPGHRHPFGLLHRPGHHPHPHPHGYHGHAPAAHDHHHGDHDPPHGHDAPSEPTEVHDHAHGFSWREIRAILAGGDLPPGARARAGSAFAALAEAEARVHGVPVDEVHFHEVGAVDSVVDIVGAALALEQLGVEAIESAPAPLGRGFARTAHGRIPLPAPATLELLRGLAVAPAGLDRELVTPTGAAFLRAWARRMGPFPEMVVERVGWGAGRADLPDRPNLLRAVLGTVEAPTEACVELTTNLDDLSPEVAGYLLERLLAAGALDAWLLPLQMKKGRPGLQVAALCAEGRRPAVEAVLFAESSALGLRRHAVTRTVLPRRFEEVETPFGRVPIKVAGPADAPLHAAPEYEVCRRLAEAAGVPLKEVFARALAAWWGGRPAAGGMP